MYDIWPHVCLSSRDQAAYICVYIYSIYICVCVYIHMYKYICTTPGRMSASLAETRPHTYACVYIVYTYVCVCIYICINIYVRHQAACLPL